MTAQPALWPDDTDFDAPVVRSLAQCRYDARVLRRAQPSWRALRREVAALQDYRCARCGEAIYVR